MKTGAAELELQDGTAIKIEGSANFVTPITAAILEVSKRVPANIFRRANLRFNETEAQRADSGTHIVRL